MYICTYIYTCLIVYIYYYPADVYNTCNICIILLHVYAHTIVLFKLTSHLVWHSFNSNVKWSLGVIHAYWSATCIALLVCIYCDMLSLFMHMNVGHALCNITSYWYLSLCYVIGTLSSKYLSKNMQYIIYICWKFQQGAGMDICL